jgi:hypothetical protein
MQRSSIQGRHARTDEPAAVPHVLQCHLRVARGAGLHGGDAVHHRGQDLKRVCTRELTGKARGAPLEGLRGINGRQIVDDDEAHVGPVVSQPPEAEHVQAQKPERQRQYDREHYPQP